MIIHCNVLDGIDLPDQSVNCCVTSPPYWGLRDYGVPGQLGLEATPEAYVENMVQVFREIRRVLKDDGTLWLNLGDTFAANRGYQVADSKHRDVGNSVGMKAANLGIKPKNLIGIPWRVAFALQADGWYLRADIIWAKPNPMPESVKDRPTRSHEYIFLFSKQERYYYDWEAIQEPVTMLSGRAATFDRSGNDVAEHVIPGQSASQHRARTDKQRGHGRRHAGFNERWDAMPKDEQCGAMRNKRDVWTVATKPYSGAHFATFPESLIEPCILAGCPEGGTVLDPFLGSGTTGAVAQRLGRKWVGCELNPKYIELAKHRTQQQYLRVAQ